MKNVTQRRLSRRLTRQIEEAATAQKDRVRETAIRLREPQRRSNKSADMQREEVMRRTMPRPRDLTDEQLRAARERLRDRRREADRLASPLLVHQLRHAEQDVCNDPDCWYCSHAS